MINFHLPYYLSHELIFAFTIHFLQKRFLLFAGQEF